MWGPDGEEARHPRGDPRLARYAGDLPGRHRRLPRPRRLRPGDDGLGAQRRPDGPGGRGVRLPRQDLRDPRRRHRAGRRRGRRRADRARRRAPATSGAPARPRTSPIRDWVKLAVTRARATGAPGRLLARREPRPRRQPDRQGRRRTSPSTTPTASTSRSWRPAEATAFSLERIRQGEDTISVTGNVLRDYLTDLFPILELGTSAKMLSIVPLINGGGLFETGAGGSAPKHVQQLVKENYLRWDSLGEFFALAASLRAPRRATTGNARAQVLADTLDRATGTFLDEDKSPAPRARRRSTTAAATSTSRSTGPRSSPRRPTTPSWPRRSRRSPRRCADARADRSSTSCSPSRARRPTSAATTAPTTAKAAAVMRPSATLQRGAGLPVSETQAPDSPRPPDIGRRTLSPFGYAVCVAVPILIAALGFTFLHFHYDKEHLVDGDARTDPHLGLAARRRIRPGAGRRRADPRRRRCLRLGTSEAPIGSSGRPATRRPCRRVGAG